MNEEFQKVISKRVNAATLKMTTRAQLKIKPRTAQDDILQKNHATQLMNQIDVYLKKTIDSVDNLNVAKDRETIALQTEINSFANDLQTLVNGLAKIMIKTYKNGHTHPDLSKATRNFSNLVYIAQNTVHRDNNILKNTLKSGLQGIDTESRQLYNLLNTEPTYINDLVGIISDILFVVRKVYYRNVIETQSRQQMKVHLAGIRSRFLQELGGVTNIANIDNATINYLIELCCHTINHMGLIVRTLDEDSDGYDDKTKSDVRQIAYNVSQDLSDLDNAIRVKGEPAVLKEHLSACCRGCVNEMTALVSLDNRSSSHEKIAVNLDNLILLVIAHYYSLAEQIIEGAHAQ